MRIITQRIFSVLFVVFILLCYITPVTAGDTVLITITANPEPNSLFPPSDFKVTKIGKDLLFTWTPNPLAVGTTIIINGKHYPTDVTDGAVVTSTDNSSYTLVNGYSDIFQNYYSAFSNSESGYSVYYATVQAGGLGMLVSVLLVFALGLMVLGYAFKLDYLKFIAGLGWVFAGYFTSYTYTWLGSAQWIFIVIGVFGLALPLWIHTIWTMSLNRKAKMQEKSKELYTDGDNDEIDAEWERDMQEWNRKPSKPTLKNQRKNSLYGRNI